MFNFKFMKIVWSINGIFIFFLAIFALYGLSKEYAPNLFRGSLRPYDRGIIVGKKAEIARELDFDLQHLMYESPMKIGNSDYYLIEVFILDKELPPSVVESISKANDISPNIIGATVNIIFFNEDRTDIRKLLDSYGYIKRIDAPVQSPWRADQDSRPKRNFILYEMAFTDSNEDGRINDKDSTAFFLSGLDGKGLKQITPSSMHFRKYFYTPDLTEIYFELLEEHQDKDVLSYLLKSRHLYYYNLKHDRFGKFEEIEEMISEIRQEFRFLTRYGHAISTVIASPTVCESGATAS